MTNGHWPETMRTTSAVDSTKLAASWDWPFGQLPNGLQTSASQLVRWRIVRRIVWDSNFERSWRSFNEESEATLCIQPVKTAGHQGSCEISQAKRSSLVSRQCPNFQSIRCPRLDGVTASISEAIGLMTKWMQNPTSFPVCSFKEELRFLNFWFIYSHWLLAKPF